MKIIQEPEHYLDPRGTIEFDEYERNGYVSRFLAVFNSGLPEDEICTQAYAIHMEIATRPDLYIAVADRLGWRFKSALHWYSQCRGQFRPKPKLRLQE
jgi:hypothetical protein